jgi:glutathione S-transferase
MGIVIHYAPQTRSVIPLWAIEELGIAYDAVKLDFRGGEHKGEVFSKINPNQRLPAMVVEGKATFESTAMVIYLAETYGPGRKLWPKEDGERAQAMGWTVWGMVQLGQDIYSHVVSSDPRVPAEMHNEAQAKAAATAIAKDLKVLDLQLAERQFVMGDAFTLADILPATAVMFGRPHSIDLAQYAHIAAWMERVTSRPALLRAQAL